MTQRCHSDDTAMAQRWHSGDTQNSQLDFLVCASSSCCIEVASVVVALLPFPMLVMLSRPGPSTTLGQHMRRRPVSSVGSFVGWFDQLEWFDERSHCSIVPSLPSLRRHRLVTVPSLSRHCPVTAPPPSPPCPWALIFSATMDAIAPSESLDQGTPHRDQSPF